MMARARKGLIALPVFIRCTGDKIVRLGRKRTYLGIVLFDPRDASDLCQARQRVAIVTEGVLVCG